MAYWKKLKNTDAVPVLKDELVFDTTPTVNSTNPVTSDGVARAIAGASGEVPVVTEGDNGKVLSAVYDAGGPAVEWAEAPSGIPAYAAGDAGKVLKVNAGATGVEWGEAGGGGGSYTAGEGISIDGSEISVSHDDTIKLAGVPQYTTSLDDLTSIYGSMMPASQYIAYKAKFDGYELSTSVGFNFKSNNSDIKMGTNRYGAGTSINGKYVKLVLANPDDRTKYVEGTVVSTATIYGGTYEAYIRDSQSGIEWAAATLQSAFDWSTPDYTLADVCDSNGYTDVYIVACESDGTLITTGNVGPSGTMYVAYYGNTATASSPLVLSATTDPQGLSVTYPVPTPTTHGYVLKSMMLDPMSLGSPVVAKWEADSVPSFSSTYDKDKVLRVGDYGLSWEKIYPYGNFTSPTVDVTADLSLKYMPQSGFRYDPTSIVVSTGVNFAVVTWTALSVTTPPTVTGSDYTYKACSSNPSTLTVGKTYVLTIIRDCYKIEEFG